MSLNNPCVVVQLVQGLATGWTDRGSNTGEREIFPLSFRPYLVPTQTSHNEY
jgi:hypothetical protein